MWGFETGENAATSAATKTRTAPTPRIRIFPNFTNDLYGPKICSKSSPIRTNFTRASTRSPHHKTVQKASAETHGMMSAAYRISCPAEDTTANVKKTG